MVNYGGQQEVGRKMRTVRAEVVISLRPSTSFILLELTFIILARPLEPMPSEVELTNEDIKALPMIGDVNLFFKNSREDPEFEVECEVMIAGPYSTRPLLYRRSSLTRRQMPMHTLLLTSLQSPPTAVNDAHMRHSACSFLTHATSSV